MDPAWPFLLMFESHDMRHTGFRRLIVVNGPSGFEASHLAILLRSACTRGMRNNTKLI